MDDYHSVQDAMVVLGMSADSSTFPLLMLNDLTCKSTNIKQAVGDSQRIDGIIWMRSGVTGGVQHASLLLPSQVEQSDSTVVQNSGMQSVSAKSIFQFLYP